jgi:macrolide phosphotransferase
MNDTTKRVREQAESSGIDLVEASMTVESMGLDFEVIFAEDITGQEWVCRIPRRKDVYDKIMEEKRILDFISRKQSIFEVPVWQIVSDDLIIYKKLTGKPAVTTDPDTQEPNWVFDPEAVPEAYITSLGQSLAALHNLPLDEASEAGVNVYSAEEVRSTLKSRMNKIKNNYTVDVKLWKQWQTWVNDETYWPKHTVLVHGDLFPGHTLVGDDNRVTGIIDWTEAEGSDPSIDFSAIYMLFGEEGLDKLIEAYRAAGGRTWPKMKEHTIQRLSIQAITIAEFAESSGLEDYRKMAEDMLKGN